MKTPAEKARRNRAMLPKIAFRKLPARVRQNIDEFVFEKAEGGTVAAFYGGQYIATWTGKAWVQAPYGRRDMDHRFQLPGGLEYTAEERARILKASRRAAKLRALRRGQPSAGAFQAPKGARDPKGGLRWKQDGYLHFAHGPEGMWTIEQHRGRFLLTLDLAGAHRGGATQDFGAHKTLAKAKAEAARGHRALRSQERDPEIHTPRGSTHGRNYAAFATEVRALLHARGMTKAEAVAWVERGRAIVHDAWRTNKAPCAVADTLAAGMRRRDPSMKSTRARKTIDEYEIQSNWGYGHGWEVVTTETTLKEARARLREYRENEPGVPHRLVKKQLRIQLRLPGVRDPGRKLSRAQKTFLLRLEGFFTPDALFFGRDRATLKSLLRMGLVAEQTRGKTKGYIVSRAGRAAAHPFGF